MVHNRTESLFWASCIQIITVCLINFRFRSSSAFVYVCHFCGFCSELLRQVRTHVVKCKSFGLLPLEILNGFKPLCDDEMRDTNDVWSSDILSRSQRQKKTDKLKCEECGITFAASTELILHTEKVKCKSIQVRSRYLMTSDKFNPVNDVTQI